MKAIAIRLQRQAESWHTLAVKTQDRALEMPAGNARQIALGSAACYQKHAATDYRLARQMMEGVKA